MPLLYINIKADAFLFVKKPQLFNFKKYLQLVVQLCLSFSYLFNDALIFINQDPKECLMQDFF